MGDLLFYLDGKEILNLHIATPLDLINISEEGLPKSALESLLQLLEVPIKNISSLVNMSERSFQRYKHNDKLNQSISEQVLQIAEIVKRGIEVFEDEKKFKGWFKSHLRAFGNKRPIDIIKYRFGSKLILTELGRIEYGVYS